MSEIERLMNVIIELKEPNIFSVGLQKRDHTSKWLAYVDIRCGENYSATGATPEDALINLFKVLINIVCPHCGQRLPDELVDPATQRIG